MTMTSQSVKIAAHLLPWDRYHNDHPTNGIALSKNHHWAFDRHLITPFATGPSLSGARRLASTTGWRGIRNCSSWRSAASCYRGRNASGLRMRPCSGGRNGCGWHNREYLYIKENKPLLDRISRNKKRLTLQIQSFM